MKTVENKVIINIDFGHGEVAVTYIDGDKIKVLTLNTKQHATVLTTAIAIAKDGSCIIGSEASAASNVYAYFKKSPKHWDETPEGRDISSKELMFYYFRQLMKQIQTDNPEVFFGKTLSDICLVVGCPSSPEWLDPSPKEQYANLIREATGVSLVSIVPESRAAIFSVFNLHSGLTIDATKGIAVFDLGSLTADFTYLLLAKRRLEYSWTLGAGKIEENLLNLMFKDNNESADHVQHPLMAQQLDARKFKEEYFKAVNEGLSYSKPMTLDFIRTDAIGKPIVIKKDKNGNDVYEKTYPTIIVDDETMDRCVYELPVDGVAENGISRAAISWYDHCEDFFRTMQSRLQAEDLPCETIVLTGGASNMRFVYDLCKKHFSNSQIYMEHNTSYSVATGLGFLAGGEQSKPQLLENSRGELEESIRKEIANAIDDAAENIAEAYIQPLENAFASLSQKHEQIGKQTLAQILSEVEPAVKSVSTQELIVAALGNMRNNVIKNAGEFAQKIVLNMYPGLSGTTNVKYSNKFVEDALLKYNYDISVERIIKNIDIASFTTKLAANAAAFAIGSIVFAVFSEVPVINGFLAGLAFGLARRMIENAITNNPEYKINCKKLYKGFKRNPQKFKSDIKNGVKESLENALQGKTEEGTYDSDGCMGENYNSFVKSVADVAEELVDVLALQDFSKTN